MVEIVGYVNIYNKKATRNEYGWQIVLVVGGLRERFNDSSVSLDSRINDTATSWLLKFFRGFITKCLSKFALHKQYASIFCNKFAFSGSY